jgi:hypothetical protein
MRLPLPGSARSVFILIGAAVGAIVLAILENGFRHYFPEDWLMIQFLLWGKISCVFLDIVEFAATISEKLSALFFDTSLAIARRFVSWREHLRQMFRKSGSSTINPELPEPTQGDNFEVSQRAAKEAETTGATNAPSSGQHRS